jgi:hypothetical protein
MSFVEGSEGFEVEPTVEADELPELSDYGKRFVENAPEEERPYAEKYVRQWDQGYAKQKQRWEQEIAPYRELGDPTVARQGVQLYNILMHEPERLLRHLVEERGLTLPQAKQAVKEMQNEEQESDPYAERFQTLEQRQQQMFQMQQEQLRQQVQKQQEDQLRADLLTAKQKHGDYDQDYVLQRLIAGQAQSVDEAVQQYKAYVQQILKQHGRATAPNLLGAGAGSPQAQTKKNGPIPDKEVVNHLTALLEQGKHA